MAAATYGIIASAFSMAMDVTRCIEIFKSAYDNNQEVQPNVARLKVTVDCLGVLLHTLARPPTSDQVPPAIANLVSPVTANEVLPAKEVPENLIDSLGAAFENGRRLLEEYSKHAGWKSYVRHNSGAMGRSIDRYNEALRHYLEILTAIVAVQTKSDLQEMNTGIQTVVTTAAGEIITKISTSSGEIQTEMKTAVDSAAGQIITQIIRAANETSQGGIKAIQDNLSKQLDQRIDQLQTFCKRIRESEGDPGANKRSKLSAEITEIKCAVCGEGPLVVQKGLITSMFRCNSCYVWKHLPCATKEGDEPKEPYTCRDCREEPFTCRDCMKGDIAGVPWITCNACGDSFHATCAEESLTKDDTKETEHTSVFICKSCRKTQVSGLEGRTPEES